MKVLISPSSFGQCGNEPLDILKQRGFEYINNPYGRKLTPAEVIELGKECIGIVAGVESLSKEVMDNMPSLKCISRVGVGMDTVDLDYAKEKGITVVNTPDGPTRPVAELTIALTLDLLRGVSISDRSIRNGVWRKSVGNLLLGKKIGIIGFGRIGKLTASLFSAFGCSISAYDLYPDKVYMEKNGIANPGLETLLKESDIVTLHLPGNKDKSPVIKKEDIMLMKNSALLINVSRGGVVDENALYEILKDKKIAGAACDVFIEEPYSGALKELDNIILTPHLGSYAEEAKLKMEIDAVKNLIDSLN